MARSNVAASRSSTAPTAASSPGVILSAASTRLVSATSAKWRSSISSPAASACAARANGEPAVSPSRCARAVGTRSAALLEGAKDAGFADDRLHHFDDANGAAQFLKSFIKEGDLVLIKASRGIGLDKIVTQLEGAR